MRGLLRQFLDNPEGLLEVCRARIRERDPEIRAWVEVSPQQPLGPGPLDGIPFGAKDIFETRGLATEYGSPLYAGRKGDTDAALVTDLRRRGALLLGKTQTTAFAYFDPAPTRNPRDPRHTPGGSSSGSAAAVACGMVAFALGSQTQGSVIRPAAFCGVVGFKPTFGKLSTEGVLPFAPSLDTAGLFTQTADDMRLLWELMGHDLPAPARRAGVLRQYLEGPFAAAVQRLRAAGFLIPEIDLPTGFETILPAVRRINDYEGARTHRARFEQHGQRIGRKLAELVERGLAIPEAAYRADLETLAAMRERMAPVYREHAVILTPAAPGMAPLGLDSTGDPKMNAPWTGLHGPAITVPLPVDGLPLGLQITAGRGADGILVATAGAIEEALKT